MNGQMNGHGRVSGWRGHVFQGLARLRQRYFRSNFCEIGLDQRPEALM